MTAGPEGLTNLIWILVDVQCPRIRLHSSVIGPFIWKWSDLSRTGPYAYSRCRMMGYIGSHIDTGCSQPIVELTS